MEAVAGPYPAVLRRLEPLTRVGGERELFLSTRSSWTAYFQNGTVLRERVSPVMLLCRWLKCRGLVVTSIPETAYSEGGIQFQLLRYHPTREIEFQRTVYAVNESGTWRFGLKGEPQPFEEPEQYKRRRIIDRFTCDMLERYCAAVGVRLFDPEFYGPDGYLISRAGDGRGMTIEAAQRMLGIHPCGEGARESDQDLE
jgi:hypothetical protein